MAMALGTYTSRGALGALVAALALAACITKSEIRAKGRGDHAPAIPEDDVRDGAPDAEPEPDAEPGSDAGTAPICEELASDCPNNDVHRPFAAPARATPVAVIPPPPGVKDRVLDQVVVLGSGKLLWLFSGTTLEDTSVVPSGVLDGYVSSAGTGEGTPWVCSEAVPEQTLSLDDTLDPGSGVPAPFLMPLELENDFEVALSVGGFGPRDPDGGTRNLFLLRRYGDSGRDVYLAALRADGSVERGVGKTHFVEYMAARLGRRSSRCHATKI